MFRIVVLVFFYHHALSQPMSNEVSSRLPRELIECCPCPDARDVKDWLGDSQLARAGDDCPCRTRGGDSDGASSLFFPAALRPDGSQMRPSDTKEDPKNLLEPEVALATSVLDTLREVTEEEYRDALEREAARNANPDPVPEETARNVVIVLNPQNSDDNEDFISEASHVQESRCIHPLESTPLSKMSASNQITILPKSFKQLTLPHRNLLHFDSDLGASNVEESIVDPNENILQSSLEAPGLGNTIPLKNLLDNENDGFKFRNPNYKLGKFNNNESIERFRLSLEPKYNLDINNDGDLRSDSSNIQSQLELTNDKNIHLFGNQNLPLTLRNLLKLRDVELIPKSIRNKPWAKSKVDTSKFAIPTLFKYNRNNDCNGEEQYLKDITMNSENINSEQRKITETNIDTSEIDDREEFQNSGINSRHEINTSFNEIIRDSDYNENMNDSEKGDNVRDTDLNLDAYSSPSQIQSVFMETDNQMDLGTTTPIKSDCTDNFAQLKISDTNNEPIEIQKIFQETDSNSPELGSVLFLTEDSSNFNDNTKASDFSQEQDINTNQDDSETNSSNTFALEPLQNTLCESEESQENMAVDSKSIEKDATSNKVTSQSFVKTMDDSNVEPQIEEVPNLSKTLSNLRENVVKQLDNLKKPSIKSVLFNTFSKNDKLNEDNEREVSNDGKVDQVMTNMNFGNDDVIENVSDISMNDLQTMSNNLLYNNINDQSNKHTMDTTVSSKTSETNSKNDNELLETNLNPIVTNEELNIKENACLTSLETKNADNTESNGVKSVIKDVQETEMDTGASNTVINTLPSVLDVLNPNLKLRTPLISDINLSPPTDPLNLLGKPLGDVLNINTNLPTLDGLRERVVNIFSIDNGSLDSDPPSLEADFTNDSPLKTMATEASRRNSYKELPLLKQLDDFSHNIIQNKLKITPFDSLTKSRTLDLNSYRAHLPSPNSLDLKPLKIEPRLKNRTGKNKLLIDLGSDRTILRKSSPKILVNNHLDSLPNFEDLRYALQSNARNLLINPTLPDLNLLTGNFRSNDIEDVAKNIRLNTEKTFKGLQRKIKLSSKKSSIGDSLTNPQEILDDMNDKLKGIHYDLNDRLSSIRENVIDSAKLRTVDQPRKAANRNVMTNLRKSKLKTTSPRLQTSASTTKNQELPSEPRNFIAPDWIRSHKKQNVAESAPTPKSVNAPLSYSHRKSSPLKHNPFETESLPERKLTLSLNRDVTKDKDMKRPLFRTAASPFNSQHKQNKVTISFGTTTAPPRLPPRPIVPPRPISRVPNMSKSQSEDGNPQSTSSGSIDTSTKAKSPITSKSLSGRFTPLRTSAPIPSSVDEDYEDTLNNFADEDFPSIDTKSKSSVFREMSEPDLKIKTNSNRRISVNSFGENIENLPSMSTSKSLIKPNWPRVTENSFLPRARDAVNLKKLNNVPMSIKDVKNEQSDMLRSPTENTGMVIGEPLKENVSYKCRMVCTKEIK